MAGSVRGVVGVAGSIRKAGKVAGGAPEAGAPTMRQAAAGRGAEQGADAAGRGSRNPKVAEAAARGRQMHRQHEYGPGYEREVTLPSGKRADAVNWEARDVVELKPNNPNAVKRGERQVESYRRELESVTGDSWTSRVETYE